jgi:H+/Cl- antiporter ClcA
VLTGGLIGLASWALPLAAFSGEQQLKPLLLERLGPEGALLILAGAFKLLLAGLCLESGWRGGLIFPVLTGSAAIGIGLHQLLPALGDAGLWCGSVVGGSLGTLLPSPLLALVLGLALLRGHGADALLLGLLISQVVRSRPLQGEG